MQCGEFSISRHSLALVSVLLCGAADAWATPGASPLPAALEPPVASRSDLLVVYGIPHRAAPAAALVYSRPREQSLDDLIARVARAYRLEPSLVKAVIAVESDFDPLAVSRRGAQGMMQLMPGTARELGVVRPFAVEDNVDGGVRYLRWMLDRYGGNADHALAAYNAGPGAVDAHGGIPPYAETQRYVRRVRTLHRSYQHAFTR